MNIINQQEIKVNERKRNQDLYSIFSTKNYQKKQKQVSNPYQNANKRKLRIFPINTLSRLVCLYV